MSLLTVPSSEEVAATLEKVFGHVSVFPLPRHEEGVVWDSFLSVSLHEVSTSVLLKTDGFHVEVRDGMASEIKNCGLSVKDMVEYAVKENLKCLSRHIAGRMTSVSRLRLHESLLVETLS